MQVNNKWLLKDINKYLAVIKVQDTLLLEAISKSLEDLSTKSKVIPMHQELSFKTLNLDLLPKNPIS